MKKIIFFLSFFLFSANVIAISMSQMPLENRIIIFEPYLEKDFSVSVYNSERIESVIYPGSLGAYATLIDDDPYGGPREIKMHLSLPETLDPGVYEVIFGGKEYRNVGGTVGGLASVVTRIKILSLHEGVYPDFSLSANDMGLGEKMNLTVNIENFGTQDIQNAYASIEIYDPNNNLVTTLKTANVLVPSKKNDLQPVIVKVAFDSSQFNLQPGFYKAVATLSYDGRTMPEKREATFRLGTLEVFVRDWTKVIYANVTNKFVVTIESDWAGGIEDVFARVYVPDQVLKTPNLDLSKFQTASLETYWEAKKLELRNYTITIEVFYAGTSIKKDVQVEVVAPIEPVEEKPFKISPMAIGAIILALLIALNIYFFVFKKNNDKDGNKRTLEGDASGNNAPKNNIQPPKM